jgi:hypothetical protein
VCSFLGLVLLSMGLIPFLGQNFFPGINSDEIDMAPAVGSGNPNP